MVLACFWLLFAIALVTPMRFAIYLFFVSLAFGSLNTIPGSVTLTPYAICAPLLIVKVLLGTAQPEVLTDALLDWRKLGLLTGFVLVALAVTITAPTVFSGVPTIGLNNAIATPLHFSAGNITQPLYLLTSASITASVYLLMINADRRILLAQGLMLCGASFCIAGTLDTAFAGTNVLSPVRTATYALLADGDMGGMRRVIGFNNEASAYGGATLCLAAILLFVRPARPGGGWLAHMELPLAIALIVFTILSTSSGAYAGLGVLLALWVGKAFYDAIFASSPAEKRSSTIDLLLVCLVVSIAATVMLLRPQIVDAAYQAIDTIVLQKKSSDSYVERSSWNSVSFEGMMQTFGFGVGVGSTRASSWPVAVISGTGFLGATFMAAFIARCVLTPVPPGDLAIRRMASGARFAWLVCAIPAAGAGTSVDYGFASAILFAIMAAIPAILSPARWSRRRREPSPVARPAGAPHMLADRR